ncbi:MAG: nicotinamide-nucleotide adenylyltransferase [Candidatus Heimdallarchaeota archaeon]|nr:nicotinamide-nucleotide adenylyltransferase [Candidatus Heimdallarchaeota archaeon]
MRGMIVGRFQPFHLGHLNAVKYILSEMDDLIIIIAASQQSHQPDNPFTAGERYTMIHNALVDELKDITQVIIIPANDIRDNGLWVAHLTRLVPNFDIVYANNPLTAFLFQQAGKEVRNPPLYERTEYNADHIRDLILQEDNTWKKLVPKAVVKVINEIDGIKRIKIVNSTDKS